MLPRKKCIAKGGERYKGAGTTQLQYNLLAYEMKGVGQGGSRQMGSWE